MEKWKNPKIFDMEDLEYLRGLRPNGIVLTFYLPNRQEENINTIWDSLKHEAKERIKTSRIDKAEEKKTINTIGEIDKYLESAVGVGYYNTLIIFINDNKLDIYTVPELIEKDLKISKLPFYKPLETAYQRNGFIFVASVDRVKTEFYSLNWDRFHKEYGFSKYQVPQKIKGGSASWKGLKEKNILHHIEWHLDEHLKESANDLYLYYKKERFKKLIIGGHREMIGKFEKRIHPELRKIIIDRFYGEPDIVLREVKKDGIKALKKYKL